MLLLMFKVPILISAFWYWRVSGNEKGAATFWGFSAFVATSVFLGFSVFLGMYGMGSFLLSWLLFWGLSYTEGTFWFYPGCFLAFVVLLGSSVFVGF